MYSDWVYLNCLKASISASPSHNDNAWCLLSSKKWDKAKCLIFPFLLSASICIIPPSSLQEIWKTKSFGNCQSPSPAKMSSSSPSSSFPSPRQWNLAFVALREKVTFESAKADDNFHPQKWKPWVYENGRPDVRISSGVPLQLVYPASPGGWCASAPTSRFYINCWRDAVREKSIIPRVESSSITLVK